MRDQDKFHVTFGRKRDTSDFFADYADAEAFLKRKAAKESDGDTWYIYQAIAEAKTPVPSIEVVTL